MSKVILVGWLIVIILILMVLISYMLFAPFYVEINSRNGLFRIRFHHFASARLIVNDQMLGMAWKIGWWGRTLNLLEHKQEKKGETIGLPSVKRKANTSRKRLSWKQMRAVLRSFKIERCEIDVDMGDMPLNGILYPVFIWVSAHFQKNIRINFIGEDVIVLVIRNRLARVAWAFLTGK